MSATLAEPATTDQPRGLGRPEKRGWSLILVASTTLAALLGAAIYLVVRSPSYESTGNVLVAPLATDDRNFEGVPLIRESSDGTRPVQTATGLLSTPADAQAAAVSLGPEWDQAKVEGAVRVQPRGESDIVAITATADSASEAAKVANLYMHSALELRRKAIEPALDREIRILSGQPGSAERIERLRTAREDGDPTLGVTASAQPPTGSASTSTGLVLLVALVVGVLAGVVAALVVDVVRGPDRVASQA
jgi:capsular polysaccharide biosynthesis protein